MAAITAASFAGQLDNSKLPSALTTPLKRLGSTAVAAGVPPIPTGTTSQVAALIRSFTDTAFLRGMTTTMLIAAGICFVGAVLGLLVRPRAAHQDDT
jgi:small basic protein